MKPFHIVLMVVSSAILAACGSDSSPPENPSRAASCPAPVVMTDGEMVTYSFTYSDGEQTDHTVTKVADGNEAGEVIYSVSDGRTANFVLSDLCAGVNPTSLGTEEAFLLAGASLIPSEPPNRNQDAPPPIDFNQQSCAQASATVAAGEFLANQCTFASTSSDISITQATHQALGQAMPLLGLLKLGTHKTKRDVVVELKEWNGL